MKKIVKKWEGGAKKHGGIGKAMGVQIDKWIQRDEEQAKEAREAEELRQRLEHERLAKEAEERVRLEQEQIRRALELSKKQAEELAAKKLSKEAEEQRIRLEQEQIKQALEFSQKQVEELEPPKMAEKLSKESFEKLQREKILEFLRKPDYVTSDKTAFTAIKTIQKWESTNTELIKKLRSFEDSVLNSFLDGEVDIAGGDSSF